MDDWNIIKTQEDIDFLMSAYGDFHDAVIASANYQNGYYVDDEIAFLQAGRAYFSVIFQCQWKPRIIEMQFVGLRQTHLTGWQENYWQIISEAYLAFHESLLPGGPSKVIVWADDDEFDIEKLNSKIHESSETYIVANSLRWRIVKE